MFKVEIKHIYFSAAHFLIGECIHGHNYEVKVKVAGTLNHDDMLIDFLKLEKTIRDVTCELDHKLLLPTNSALVYKQQESNLEIRLGNDFFSIPLSNILILPISNTSTELLAKYLSDNIYNKLELSLAIEVEVSEYVGASASYIRS